jgi:polyphosphate kinase
MERNLDRLVETLVLVRDAGFARHMRDVIFDAYLRDTERAYVLVRSHLRTDPAGGGEGRVNQKPTVMAITTVGLASGLKT